MKITIDVERIRPIIAEATAHALSSHRVVANPRHRVVVALVDGEHRLDRRASEEEESRVLRAIGVTCSIALTAEGVTANGNGPSGLEIAEYVGVYAEITRVLDDAGVPSTWPGVAPASPMTLVERVRMFASTHAVAKRSQLAKAIDEAR